MRVLCAYIEVFHSKLLLKCSKDHIVEYRLVFQILESYDCNFQGFQYTHYYYLGLKLL